MFKYRRGAVQAQLDDDETALLRKMVSEYVELLEHAGSSHDAVLTRLFPSASQDDLAVAAEFREMAAGDLVDHKMATAATVLQSLGDAGSYEKTLTDEVRESWLVLLTDLRLSLGTRLEVDEEKMAKPVDPMDPSQWQFAVLHWLGALQESLVQASTKANRY